MKYRIRLRISHSYPNPAVGGRHQVCVMPLDLPGAQILTDGKLTITPHPHERQERRDFFGNHWTDFTFRGPHDRATIEMEAVVDRSSAMPHPEKSDLIADLPQILARCRDLGPQSPLHFVQASVRVPRDAAMISFAREQVHAGMTVTEAVHLLGNSLHRLMTFDASATKVDTPAAEAFAKRKGVCQDFSHILIACLRGLGVPAGYVSGYLRTTPPKGRPRLEGADAMHAWVRAWAGASCGWIAFDPTNAMAAGEDHIVVAYGRDYSDVAPIRGTLRLSGGQKSKQSVDVIPLAR